jgi:phage/plasmid-associated DNA primase
MVNIKYQRQLRGVVFRCFPILQANAMPSFPDDAGAVSSKLIILPFRRSFVGNQDPDLPSKLRGELPGIAQRLMAAAIRLEATPSRERWPAVDGASDILAHMAVEGNPFDAFLKWAFVESPASIVSADYVWSKRLDFEAEIGVQLRRRDGKRVPDSQLMFYLESASSWRVAKTTGGNGALGLKGVAMKGIA